VAFWEAGSLTYLVTTCVASPAFYTEGYREKEHEGHQHELINTRAGKEKGGPELRS
jgi:hypothetical protein